MPQIQVQQVRAPDYTGVSRILQNAAQQTDKAISSAQGLLADYQNGQQTKNDLEVTTALAGIKDEAGLDAYLNSGALRGKNISEKLQGDILEFRKSIIANNQGRANVGLTGVNTELVKANTGLVNEQTLTEGVRRNDLKAGIGVKEANTRNIDAQTVIAQAAEGRRSTVFDDTQATLAADRGSVNDLLSLSDLAQQAQGEAPFKSASVDLPNVVVPQTPQTTNDVIAAAAQPQPIQTAEPQGLRGSINVGPTPTISNDAPPAQKQADIYTGLKSRGISDVAAQGIMTAFRDESNFDAGVNEKNPTVPGSRGGFGLYQLTGPRRVAYEKFAEA